MLAKDVKLNNLKTQREFIKNKILEAKLQENGNPSYIYEGYIYPENVDYFEKEEGFDILLFDTERMIIATRGKPVYLFIPKKLQLTEEELKQAEL